MTDKLSFKRRYEDLFSALFLWSLDRWGSNHAMASTYTFLALWASVMMNFNVAVIFTRILLGERLTSYFIWMVVASVIVPFTIFNYRRLLRQRQYLRAAREFGRYSAQRQRRLRMLGFIYVAGSFASVFLVGIVVAHLQARGVVP